jgi:hypothetical protein
MMNSNLFQHCRRFVRADFLGPKDFLLRATAIAVLFLVAHLAGLREYTSFLSGTVPSPDMGWQQAAFGGLVYLILYFAFVLLVPMLVIAALLQILFRFLMRWLKPESKYTQDSIPQTQIAPVSASQH